MRRTRDRCDQAKAPALRRRGGGSNHVKAPLAGEESASRQAEAMPKVEEEARVTTWRGGFRYKKKVNTLVLANKDLERGDVL
jgi:hypothetical protein